jgi:F-type H+-transporting ATPase subunit a
MHETELWITRLLNSLLGGPASAFLTAIGWHVEDPAKPWTNYLAMEVLVIVVMMLAAALLRARLSVDKPGKFQLAIEGIYGFLKEQAHEVIGHGSQKYVAFFSTIFLFILISNLAGVVPTLESPTMYYYVPAGIALCSFLYYNGQGFRQQGVLKYLGHFAGPMWWLAWFMFPLELISHCIRPVSLTIRLFANMFAGEQVTIGFMSLVPLVVPVVFMGLHVFVSLLQAFIFTILSIAYVGEAVAHEEH